MERLQHAVLKVDRAETEQQRLYGDECKHDVFGCDGEFVSVVRAHRMELLV